MSCLGIYKFPWCLNKIGASGGGGGWSLDTNGANGFQAPLIDEFFEHFARYKLCYILDKAKGTYKGTRPDVPLAISPLSPMASRL